MANDFGHDVNSASSSAASAEPQRLRFGAFDLDTENRELRRRGLRVKLQQKPFQILHLLTAQAGRYVTRTELARHLWPDLHVDFDRSLNTAMNSLRRALGDSPDNPRFIETRSGLGYRFIAPVEKIHEHAIAHPATGKPEETNNGNLDAYHDYLKGRYFQNKMTEEDLGRSVGYFEAALQADPNCALAYAGLADTYTLFATAGVMSAREAHSRSKELAGKALAIDDSLAEAHAALATIKWLDDWDFAGAEAGFRKALSIRPGYAHGHRTHATLLSSLRRHPEAIREIRQAHVLDPLSLVINADAAWILYMARDYQDAVEQAWRALAMEPRFGPAQHALGLAYQQMGMLEEAIVELENARDSWGNHPAAAAALGHAYAAAGQRRPAEDLLRELEGRTNGQQVSKYWIALLHAGLGATGTAVELLEQACNGRDAWAVWLEVDPRFDSIPADARSRGRAQLIRPYTVERV